MSRLLTPILVLPLAVVAMGVLIATAYRADRSRIETQRAERLRGADEELRVLELRLVRSLETRTDLPASVADARRTYAATAEPVRRHDAFESLAAATATYFAALDRPGRRDPVADEAAGLINRWKLAAEEYRRFASQR